MYGQYSEVIVDVFFIYSPLERYFFPFLHISRISDAERKQARCFLNEIPQPTLEKQKPLSLYIFLQVRLLTSAFFALHSKLAVNKVLEAHEYLYTQRYVYVHLVYAESELKLRFPIT